ERYHAVASTGDDQRFHAHAAQELASGIRQQVVIFAVTAAAVADAQPESGFHFRFIGRSRGDAFELQNAIAGVERYRDAVHTPVGAHCLPHRWRSRAVAVVRDEERIRDPSIGPRLVHQPAQRTAGGRNLRFAIHAHYLLAAGVRLAGKDARLGDGGVALEPGDAGDGYVLAAKAVQQQIAGLVVADHADRKHIHAERGQIVYGVGAAT